MLVFCDCLLAVAPVLQPKNFGLPTDRRRGIVPAVSSRPRLHLLLYTAFRGEAVFPGHVDICALVILCFGLGLLFIKSHPRNSRDCYVQGPKRKDGTALSECFAPFAGGFGMCAFLRHAQGTAERTNRSCAERAHRDR